MMCIYTYLTNIQVILNTQQNIKKKKINIFKLKKILTGRYCPHNVTYYHKKEVTKCWRTRTIEFVSEQSQTTNLFFFENIEYLLSM